MAKLSEQDKQAFRELTTRGYVQSDTERSPVFAPDTIEARAQYIEWVTEYSKLCKVEKPVRFSGDNWKL